MDAFVVIDVIEHCALVSHHECVGGENRGRNGRGSVNGKEGVNSGELAADFFFLNVEEASNVLDHLFVGKGQVAAGRTVWRGRGNEVRGAASVVNRRRRAGGNKNGGG